MSEYEEAFNRDLFFLMAKRKPRFWNRLLKRWLWCIRGLYNYRYHHRSSDDMENKTVHKGTLNGKYI